MKLSRLIFTFIVALATSTAFATSTLGTAGAADVPHTLGKTRAEVRMELIQAYRDGLLPTANNDYPPSAETQEHNRERLAATHPAWATAR